MTTRARMAVLACLMGTLTAVALPADIGARSRGPKHPGIAFTGASIKIGDLHALGTYIADGFAGLAAPAVARVRRMGVDWVREEFRADHLHTSANRPYYFPPYDAVVKRERAAGMHILGLLDYNNTFNHRDHVWMGHSHLVHLTNDFVNYVTAVVKHYQNIITYWQIWNEPDIQERWKPSPSAADYAYLLRRAYWAIKNVDPKDQVVMAGPTTGNDPTATQFVHDVRKDHGRFDIVAFQPYTYRPGPQILAEAAALRSLRKPIWFSEIGWGGMSGCVPCGNPYDQANFLTAIYLISAVSGVERCFWYEFRDPSTQPLYADHFGLVAYNFRGKPAYRSFLIGRNLMDGSTLNGEAQLGPYVALYRFSRNHRVFYELWNETSAPQMVNVAWGHHFVNVDNSILRHLTAAYGNRLHLVVAPYAVDYLVPPALKVSWNFSPPMAGIHAG
jgi:polysaccharide biosynthesis protein PslG